MLSGIQKIERELANLNTPNLRYKFEYFREEPHQNTPIYGTIGALRGLYPQWSIPYETSVEGYESVLAHFKKLSTLYGYQIEPKSWQMYDEGIGQLTYLENPAEAIKYFSYNISQEPSAYSSRLHIVDAFVKLGKKQEALKHLNILLRRDDLSDEERQQLTEKKSNVNLM
ncbi:hypothetical protein AOR04_18390 [Pseudoalteromonas sp. 1_2015MBL_MicDiv]|nr:hypothetical protein AOR04_18390 [Pseudoalteromonas sp. 1_2015MBL_MicDiv]